MVADYLFSVAALSCDVWVPGRAARARDDICWEERSLPYWVYILASKPRGTLYVGVTDDLVRRTAEHREGLVPGFTKTYGATMLVYFEQNANVLEAIKREKRVKRWARDWKIALIRETNPEWRDLFDEIV